MAEQTTTGTAGTEKVYSQKDIDAERARAQRAEQMAQEAEDRAKDLEGKFNKIKTDFDGLKNKSVVGDEKAIEERIKSVRGEVEEDFKKNYGKKIEDLETANNQKDKELKRFRVTNEGLQKANGKFLPEALKFVEQAIEQHCDWDGEKIVVKGSDGKPRLSPANPKSPMSVDEFLAEFADANPFMVPPTTRKGTDDGRTRTGSSQSQNKAVVAPPAGFEQMSQIDQQRWFEQNPESGRAYMKQRGWI